jgi:hypothetical protein
MRLTTHRSVGARLTTSIVGLLVGAGIGFTAGMTAAALLTPVMEHVGTTDTEGWGVIIVWVLFAFVGLGVGALVGAVVGYRRRPLPAVPPRPDARPELEPTAS